MGSSLIRTGSPASCTLKAALSLLSNGGVPTSNFRDTLLFFKKFDFLDVVDPFLTDYLPLE
jgi:hypothetical protein